MSPVGQRGDDIIASLQGHGKRLRSLELGRRAPLPKFHAQRITNGSAISSETSPVWYDSELYDIGNNFAAGTGTLTVPSNGVWHFDAHVLMVEAKAVTADVGLALWKNGARLRFIAFRLASNRANSDHIYGSTDEQLVAGDTVQIRPYSAAGAITPYGADGVGAFTYFSGHMLP